MSRSGVVRRHAARLGVLGAAGACVVGLMIPAAGATGSGGSGGSSGPAAPPAGALVVGTKSATCANPAFPTIQQAVAAAQPGGTVYVCPGSYTGPVVIDKTLKLLGAQYGRDARTGRADAKQESTITSATAGFQFGAVNGWSVDGFSFRGSTGDGLDAINRGSGWSIANNIFADNQNGMNVNATGPARSTISKNRFSDNNRNANSGQGGQGILFTSGPANNVTVSDDLFERHFNAAFNSIGDPSNRSTGVVVQNNRSVDDSSFAVVNNANGAVVANNVATKAPSAEDGSIIYIVGNTDRLTIRANQLSGDVGTGISANAAFGSAASTNLLIEANAISNRTTGISINDNHTSVTVRSNSVSNSTRSATAPGRGIRLQAGSSGLVVTSNAVSRSSDVDCVDESRGTRTAGTADTWTSNAGQTASPAGLCSPGRAPAPSPTTPR